MSEFREPLSSQEEATQLEEALAASISSQTGVGPAVGLAPEVPTACEATLSRASSEESLCGFVFASARASTVTSEVGDPTEEPVVEGGAPDDEADVHHLTVALLAGRLFTAAGLAPRGLRFYAVWVAPGVDQAVLGVHISTGSLGWYELVQHLPHQRYSYFDGTRLRRFPTLEAARLGYCAGSVGTTNPLPAPILRW
jgi:hypothetical protein